MFYRLKAKAGPHSVGNKEYVAGDVIESDKDLTKVFIGKFEKCHDSDAEDTGTSKPSIETPSNAGDGKDNKSKSSPSSGKKSEKKSAKSKAGKNADEDVTSGYPTAEDIGVKVMKKTKSNGEWFYVIDPDDNDAQMNKKMLREKNVNKFIASITED